MQILAPVLVITVWVVPIAVVVLVALNFHRRIKALEEKAPNREGGVI